MRVYLAEKPSVGRAIAAVLPGPQQWRAGHIVVGNGDIVTWCIGHLLEQVPPDGYDAKFKTWRMSDLPIVPTTWKLAPRKSASGQLAVVRRLLKSAAEIIHAGDPDREGQLLVDEVIHYLRVPANKKSKILRLLISDLNPSAVRRQLQSMRSNRDFAPLSSSALARSRADWLYGMNMSRAYTLLGQRAGYQGVLSVGRVQTPVLGLIVRRDDDIAKFVPRDHYQVDALLPYRDKDIKARWKPSAECRQWQDEEGRVLVRTLAENVCARIANQPATVTMSMRKTTQQAPPLPYSLSALQIDAAKRFGMTAANVLSCCQSLYETHQAITYPRSDCRYLPRAHHPLSSDILAAIATTHAPLRNAVNGANSERWSKAWNDSKVTAHHAIVPTNRHVTLHGNEAAVYGLIAQQYIAQFYPPAVYSHSALTFEIAGGTFQSTGRELTTPGWRVLLGPKDPDNKLSDQIPPLPKGTQLLCREGVILDKRTEPPKPFTEATLLGAMTGIARFVTNKELQTVLRETDGLGTEATRASIIELLFRRQLLCRSGKTIHATKAGRGLIYALPAEVAYPDMTAKWERELGDIATEAAKYQPFMDSLEASVRQLMCTAQSSPIPDCLQGLGAPPTSKWKKPQKKSRVVRKRQDQ